MTARLFEQLFDDIVKSIDDGVLRPGDRLPSIREAGKARRLSITTVKRAYELLESRGLVEGRPQSGYFVRMRSASAPCAEPWHGGSEPAPAKVDVSRIVLSTLKAIRGHEATRFGSPYPDPALFPWRRVHQRMNEVARRFGVWDPLDDIPPGNSDLIREIARRHLHKGLDVSPGEIIVTVGATEAINLCLQAVARAGDTIAVESPGFFGVLQLIERLGMKAVEVPCSPGEGLDLKALEEIIKSQPVAACLSMPNFQNPLGFVMPDERKRAFVELARRYGLPIIENGVYNELHYEGSPTTLKCFDSEGLVLHCGSFSKCLAAGVRIGWAIPGRYRADVEKLKFLTSATSGISQMAVAQYLTLDGWDHHLRGVRRTLLQRRDIMKSMVERFFPPGTRTSDPVGGYLLWVELPQEVDGIALHREGLERGIAIAPGRVFGNSDEFRNCLRLNYSYAWTAAMETAFQRLAELVSASMIQASVSTSASNR